MIDLEIYSVADLRRAYCKIINSKLQLGQMLSKKCLYGSEKMNLTSKFRVF